MFELKRHTPKTNNCPKCGATYLTPLYNWFLNTIMLFCKCGYVQMRRPYDAVDAPEE